MKDEEMAENWIAEYTGVDVETQKAIQLQYHKNLKQAFLAGLKAGRPQWHDLQKDPNDLPKEENKIMLCYCCIGYHGNIGTYVYRLYTKKEFHKVIAWCEIPTFDKE